MRGAARAVKAKHGKAGYGDAFEDALLSRLCDPMTTEQLCEDVVAAAARKAHGLAELTSFGITRDTRWRGPGDAVAVWHFADGSVWEVLVNVKAVKQNRPIGNGVALATLLRLATEPDWTPRSQVSGNIANRAIYDTDLAIAEWVAGKRKLLPYREYLTLVAELDGNGNLTSWRWQPLLSSITSKGVLAISRHSNRDVVMMARGTDIINASHDLDQLIPRALLPCHRRGRLITQQLAALAQETKSLGPAARQLLG